jgi:uncharacterized membrane protein YccC
MSSVATRTRVNQITILAGVSILFFQLSNWGHAIWVLYSIMVVAGPFSTFLGFGKAKDRFLGTLVGVFIAFLLESVLRVVPSLLPLTAFSMTLLAGFMVLRPYKYFIIIITTCVCLSYTYMNIPYTNFTPLSFVIERSLGIFFGVLIFLVFQRFVFGSENSKLELLEESHDVLLKLQATLKQYQTAPTLMTAYQSAEDVSVNSKELKGYIESAHFVFGNESNAELCYAKQVVRLNDRAIRLLIDEPTVRPEKVEKLLHVVTLKLERQ